MRKRWRREALFLDAVDFREGNRRELRKEESQRKGSQEKFEEETSLDERIHRGNTYSYYNALIHYISYLKILVFRRDTVCKDEESRSIAMPKMRYADRRLSAASARICQYSSLEDRNA